MPAPLILTLDAAGNECSAAVVTGGTVLAWRSVPGGRGSTAALPGLARDALQAAGVTAPQLSGIAVTVGPGSFTGIRSALALAQGLGLAAGVPVQGVSLPEAIRAQFEPGLDRPFWIVVDSSRGRVFLDQAGTVRSLALADIPLPAGAIALGGDMAEPVARHLVDRGCLVQVVDAPRAGPLGIAMGAARANRAAIPLYVDPVEARPGPAGRPAPV